MASGGHEPVKAVAPAIPLTNGRQSVRPKNGTARDFDPARKQQAGPGDNMNRKAATPPLKAWQGPNPITARASNSTAHGSGPAARMSTSSNASSTDTDRIAHERLLFLLSSMSGHDASIVLKNGERYAGVLDAINFESGPRAAYTLKMTRKVKSAGSNGESTDDYIGEGEDHVSRFDVQEVVDLVANGINLGASLSNGSASSFRTDTEISRKAEQPREKKLQRWTPGPSDMSLDDLALEDTGANGWDQFKANEEKYGVTSTFDMDMYTSAIDKSHPQYKQRLAKAERLQKEIEGSVALNSHVQEERQEVNHAGEDDEETKYSGVTRDYSPLTKGGSGSYVPPSRRPITNTPTVPGAPFDPAIISSQLARPQPVSATDSVKSEDKPATSNASIESVAGSVPASATKTSPNTTEGHVRDTADAFKQFANTEKLRIRQAQEQKRTNARNEKNVRINDLKKFAENFKLKSRVPDDLVPILAKDHDKQQEIRRKAEEAAQTEEQRSKDKPTSSSPTSASRPAAKDASTAAPQLPRPKQVNNRTDLVPRPLPGMSPRQAQVFKGAPGRGLVPPQQLPTLVHIPTGPASTTVALPKIETTVSPAAGSRLSMSAKAFEFRPVANTFTPSGVSPSPQRSITEAPTDVVVPFFDEKEKENLGKGNDEDLDEDSDVIMYLRTAGITGLTDDQKKSLAPLGGVPQPYRTPPTWNVPPERINTLYEDAFGKVLPHELPMMHMAPGQFPHAHQLPPHMQHTVSAQQARYFQQGGMPQGYDPRMQYPGGPGSSLQSSPRFPNAQVNQLPQYMSMPQYGGQPVPYPGMSPNMQFRTPHTGGHANQMMMQGQHNPMTPMRGGYPGQFTANMQSMVMQPGQSPYANGLQQPYSPMSHHAQPQLHLGQGLNAGSRPGPHMMHHTGSHQGFQPHQMGMQYAQMPQGSPYAMNQRQMSAGHFQQMTPRQQQAVPANQSQPSPSPALNNGNAGKGDEGK